MSENVDLVRSIYAAWERGDFSSVEWAAPSIEYLMVDEPGSRPHTGVRAMSETWRTFLSAWDEYRLEAEEYRDLEGGRVLVLLRVFGRGKSSGVDLGEATQGRRGANLFEIRDGKVARLATYFDERRALADLGLAG